MILSTDFLLQGRKLIQDVNQPTEVDFRSAISRAYYSLYQETLNFLVVAHKQKMVSNINSYLVDVKHNVSYDNSKVQSLNIKYLHEIGVNVHETLRRVLMSLDRNLANDFLGFRDSRNEADYQINEDFSLDVQQVANELDEIEILIRSIKSL